MNRERRRMLSKGENLINQAIDILQDVLNDEDMSFNNLSDGLQCTARGEAMENNIDVLENCIEGLEDVIRLFTEIE